eukprot:g16723.t1
MGARRLRRLSDLGGYDASSVDHLARQGAPPDDQSNNTFTPRRPLKLEQKPAKPARGRSRGGARRRKLRKQAVDAKKDAGGRSISVVGEKATKVPRAEVGAGRDPARRENADSVVEEESSKKADRDHQLVGLAELVQAEIDRAAEVQVVEHLKHRTAHALNEVAVLRDELERTEAAVVGGKKKRDSDVAERESQLRRCQEEIRRLESEVEYHRVQLGKSVTEGERLGEELKRTQESLLFLSAWDEEKIELESEVASLKAQLAAVSEEGKKRLETAHQEFNYLSASAGQKARLRLESAGESEPAVGSRNGGIMYNINRIMRNAALIESDKRAARTDLEDERRLHHATIRKKKRAEAIITELQAKLSLALSSASGRPFSPSNINLSPRRQKKQWGGPRPPAPGRGKLLVRESDDRGGGYREVLPGRIEKGTSKVSMLLVPARKSQAEDEGDSQENAGADVVVAPPRERSATTTVTRIREPERPLDRDTERPTNNCLGPARVGEGGQDGDDIPELLPCGSGSDVTPRDVWGMLDSYVHRRSEVALANRHLGAIEAMRRHLDKNDKRTRNPTGSNCSATTATVQYDYRGRRRVRMGGENPERNSDEAVWRASHRKRARQEDGLSEAYAVETRSPSDWRRLAHREKAVGTKPSKPRVRLQPHPPPRFKRDGSVSSISQVTSVRFWKECERDSMPRKTRSPRGSPPPKSVSSVSRDDAASGRGGGAGKENAGRGVTVTMTSDGRPYRPRDSGNASGSHRARRGRGGSLTCPSKGDGDGDGDPSSYVSGNTASSQQQQNGEEEVSAATTVVVVRSPSAASSSLASGVGAKAKAAAGRLWGDNAVEGTLTSEPQGGGGKGLPVGLKARATARKVKAGKLGTWGKHEGRRDMELADWLESNTNMVNVSPW